MLRQCYLGLGSNLKNPASQVQHVYRALSAHPKLHDCVLSSLFTSHAMTKDGEEQADYINAVVRLQTDMRPQELLSQTQAIEKKLGREDSKGVWQSRIIDIDILLMENLVISEPGLTLPHPGLTLRPFVLYPLFEIAPNLVLPDGTDIGSLVTRIKEKDLWNTHPWVEPSPPPAPRGDASVAK